MITDFVVGLSVALDGFLLAFFNPQNDMFFLIVFLVGAINDQKIFPVFNVLDCNRVKVAFAKRQMIHRVEYISLAYAIRAHKAIDLGVEFKGAGLKVFVID
jgi:hypothetical protein